LSEEYDILVIGSGPAGNMAAIYGVRNGFRTALFTGPSVGGQLTTTVGVENFPAFPDPVSGTDLALRMLEQSRNIGVEIIQDVVASVDFSSRPLVCKTVEENFYSAKNVVIATGATPKRLGIRGEEEFRNFGVSNCAVCDGNFFKNQPVAIVGGGETAGLEAIHMSNLASKVYIVYRKDKFYRMTDITARRIRSNGKIEVIFNSEIVEICGKEKPKSVEFIRILNNRTDQHSELEVKAVFVAVGMEPKTGIFLNSGLNLSDDGYIITEKDSARTNIKNVYATGDVTDKKYKQAIIAAAHGAVAALEIEEDRMP
jgi:thioredoxin reductase (NADPH)